jgi:hypothetical protein
VVDVDWDNFYVVDTALNGIVVLVLVSIFVFVFDAVDDVIGIVTMPSVNFYVYVTEFVTGFILFMLVLIVLTILLLVELIVLFKF